MISIICIYYNQKVLDDNLLKSLETQSTDYELILLDNTNNKYNSAVEAINYGTKKAKGDFLMFVHPDVNILSDRWLENVEKTLLSLKDLGLAGVAGFPEDGKGIVSNIKDGCPPKDVGIHIDKPVEVQTVDECLFIIPKSVIENVHFDGITIPDWHLYAVDYCLNVKRAGLKVYTLPCEIYHVSRAHSFSGDYYTTLKKIIKKYGSSHDKIYTTCGVWSTDSFRLEFNIFEDKILRKLTRK